MSVVPLFRNNAFAPDEVRALEVAYLNVCAALGAAAQSPEVKERVATKIVSIAMSGERDSTRIYLRLIEDGIGNPSPPLKSFTEKCFGGFAMLATLRFLAVLLTGLALIAPAAHLFELSNKIALSKGDYFVVQGIYNGWWMVGLLLPLSFLANVSHAYVARGDKAALVLSLGAAACVLINLVVFYFFTQPANSATHNWTVQPDNWVSLRHQWEYSHAVNAGVTFLAFCLSIAGALRSGR